MKIYTHRTKNDLTAWAPIRLGGPVSTFVLPANFSLWGPGDSIAAGFNLSNYSWMLPNKLHTNITKPTRVKVRPTSTVEANAESKGGEAKAS